MIIITSTIRFDDGNDNSTKENLLHIVFLLRWKDLLKNAYLVVWKNILGYENPEIHCHWKMTNVDLLEQM